MRHRCSWPIGGLQRSRSNWGCSSGLMDNKELPIEDLQS